MSDQIKNGAPYNIIVTNLTTKKSNSYYCEDAATVVENMGTLAIEHIKGNLRKGNGVRLVFEVVIAEGPPPKPIRKKQKKEVALVKYEPKEVPACMESPQESASSPSVESSSGS